MSAEPKIKGLTLRHPWAYAFVHFGKDVENRTWQPEKQGGSVGMYLAQHGGAPMKGKAYREEVASALHWMVMVGAISDSEARLVCPDASGPRDVLSATGIVAVARIVEVCQDHATSPWAAQVSTTGCSTSRPCRSRCHTKVLRGSGRSGRTCWHGCGQATEKQGKASYDACLPRRLAYSVAASAAC